MECLTLKALKSEDSKAGIWNWRTARILGTTPEMLNINEAKVGMSVPQRQLLQLLQRDAHGHIIHPDCELPTTTVGAAELHNICTVFLALSTSQGTLDVQGRHPAGLPQSQQQSLPARLQQAEQQSLPQAGC